MAVPKATVIGIADEELTQLVRPEEAGKPRWQQAMTEDELLETVYNWLAAEAVAQQEAVEQGRVRDTMAKRNRRDTYLQPLMQARWRGRSRRFLVRRQAALKELPLSIVYSTVVLQHLLELDLADLSLPEEERRFEDSCTDGISDQFLLDAPRGRYVVEGEVYHYAETPDDVVQSIFVEALVAALRSSTPPELIEKTSGLMCQSALAALERSTLCAAAVCGGKQDVEYTLQRDPHRPKERVLVGMQVHRHGFREYLTGTDADADEGPRSSDTGSSILKSATIALEVSGEVDIVELHEEVNVLSGGELVSMDLLCRPIAKPHQAEAKPHRLHHFRRALLCLQGCFRCCPRQARQPDIQGATASSAASAVE